MKVTHTQSGRLSSIASQMNSNELPLLKASQIWTSSQVDQAAKWAASPRMAPMVLSAIEDASSSARLDGVLKQLKAICQRTLRFA